MKNFMRAWEEALNHSLKTGRQLADDSTA